jgi:hypothetical protein
MLKVFPDKDAKESNAVTEHKEPLRAFNVEVAGWRIEDTGAISYTTLSGTRCMTQKIAAVCYCSIPTILDLEHYLFFIDSDVKPAVIIYAVDDGDIYDSPSAEQYLKGVDISNNYKVAVRKLIEDDNTKMFRIVHLHQQKERPNDGGD